MQVSEQIVELLLVHGIAKGGHHAMPVKNDVGHAVVVGWSAAGQVFLLEQGLQAGTVERARVVSVVAAGAVLDENLVPPKLLRVELAQGGGRREWRAASGEQGEDEYREDEFGSRGQGIGSMIAERRPAQIMQFADFTLFLVPV